MSSAPVGPVSTVADWEAMKEPFVVRWHVSITLHLGPPKPASQLQALLCTIPWPQHSRLVSVHEIQPSVPLLPRASRFASISSTIGASQPKAADGPASFRELSCCETKLNWLALAALLANVRRPSSPEEPSTGCTLTVSADREIRPLSVVATCTLPVLSEPDPTSTFPLYTEDSW